MADPLQRAVALTPFRPSASAHNLMLDAAKRLNSGAGVPGFGDVPHLLVRVKNDTGGDLPAFSVLKVGTSILDVTEPLRVAPAPMFTGTAPASVDDAFAVLVEPANDGKFALGVVAGVVPCEINVTDAGHEYASPSVGVTARMDSSANGPVWIVDRESGTGNKKAIVMFGGFGARNSISFSYVESVSWNSSTCELTVTTKNRTVTGFGLSTSAV